MEGKKSPQGWDIQNAPPGLVYPLMRIRPTSGTTILSVRLVWPHEIWFSIQRVSMRLTFPLEDWWLHLCFRSTGSPSSQQIGHCGPSRGHHCCGVCVFHGARNDTLLDHCVVASVQVCCTLFEKPTSFCGGGRGFCCRLWDETWNVCSSPPRHFVGGYVLFCRHAAPNDRWTY